MEASPRAVTLGKRGDPFFQGIILNEAVGRLNIYEMNWNGTKKFVKKNTEKCIGLLLGAPENH